jgi:RNA polymerase sigma-70 factor (sigma-E family)
MRDEDDEEDQFARFVRNQSGELQRTAWLLTGDWALAEDLVQTALMKTWQRWTTVRRQDAPASYVRRIIVTTFLSWRRRRWSSELSSDSLGDEQVSNQCDDVDRRVELIAAVQRLPPRQRAVIILRYFNDLSETATANVLDCSTGTVKSQASKALRTLRRTTTTADLLID